MSGVWGFVDAITHAKEFVDTITRVDIRRFRSP
nr:MAG TPA: hypothetical protein [Caudoviricetes sp.]